MNTVYEITRWVGLVVVFAGLLVLALKVYNVPKQTNQHK